MFALPALPRLLASILLLTAIGGALWLAGGQLVYSQWVPDYDDDDDGLIDIRTIAQLNVIRWDPDGNSNPSLAGASFYRSAFPGSYSGMGCPGNRCYGYELRVNLTSTATWTPIANYQVILEGNGHTISGINTGVRSGRAGLFARLDTTSVVRNLGIISPTVTVNTVEDIAGGLVGELLGRLYNSYVQGGTVTGSGNTIDVGGLVGYIATTGTVESSWSSAAVTISGSNPKAGGLAGRSDGTVRASYSTGAVTGSGTYVRGLVGLDGTSIPGSAPIIDSYCDATTSGRSSDAQCRTTAQLQTPTGYTGIYANWNLDLDGNGAPDFPWDFGTSSTYPTLNSPERQLALSPIVDYDADDNGLIDVGSIAQLDAIRYDLNGDGVPTNTSTAIAAYNAAFTSRSLDSGTRMGCPGGRCAGYELTANLTFPAETSSPYNPWTPIGGSYTATFDGDGHTLSDLKITNTGGASIHLGLFRELGGSGVIRDVGLLNPAVTSTATGGDNVGDVGSLVGRVNTGGRVVAAYAAGGRIHTRGEDGKVGGLVGQNRGDIRAGYATVELDPDAARGSVYAAGLVGWLRGGSITASYAAGAIPGAPTGSDSYFAGLVGVVSHDGAIAAGYCDRQVSMQTQANCVGAVGGAGVLPGPITATSTNTAVMQAPTGYTGIYADWNIDLADDFDVDFP